MNENNEKAFSRFKELVANVNALTTKCQTKTFGKITADEVVALREAREIFLGLVQDNGGYCIPIAEKIPNTSGNGEDIRVLTNNYLDELDTALYHIKHHCVTPVDVAMLTWLSQFLTDAQNNNATETQTENMPEDAPDGEKLPGCKHCERFWNREPETDGQTDVQTPCGECTCEADESAPDSAPCCEAEQPDYPMHAAKPLGVDELHALIEIQRDVAKSDEDSAKLLMHAILIIITDNDYSDIPDADIKSFVASADELFGDDDDCKDYEDDEDLAFIEDINTDNTKSCSTCIYGNLVKIGSRNFSAHVVKCEFEKDYKNEYRSTNSRCAHSIDLRLYEMKHGDRAHKLDPSECEIEHDD